MAVYCILQLMRFHKEEGASIPKTREERRERIDRLIVPVIYSLFYFTSILSDSRLISVCGGGNLSEPDP